MMEQNVIRDDEIEIDLKEICRVLLSKLWLILILGILFGLATLIYSKYVVDPVYSSTTKVYVLSRQNSEANVTYTDLQTGAQLTKDYVELIKSRTVLNQVLDNLDLDMSADELSRMITASTTEETRIITITVDNTDVYEAQKIADNLREVASRHICEVMNLEAVNTVDPADAPPVPSSPNVTRNTVLGVGVGIFIGMAIVIIMYLTDDSIRTPDDVERYLKVSVLASIPVLEDESKRKKKRRHSYSEFNAEKNRSAQKREKYDDDSFTDDYHDDSVEESQEGLP